MLKATCFSQRCENLQDSNWWIPTAVEKKISVAMHSHITGQKGALPRNNNSSDSTMYCKCLWHGQRKETHADNKNMTGLIMCLGAKWDPSCTEHMHTHTQKKQQQKTAWVQVNCFTATETLWIIRDGEPLMATLTLTQLLHSESAWKLILGYLPMS